MHGEVILARLTATAIGSQLPWDMPHQNGDMDRSYMRAYVHTLADTSTTINALSTGLSSQAAAGIPTSVAD